MCSVVTNGSASFNIAREVDAHDMSESYGRSIERVEVINQYKCMIVIYY